MQSKAKPIRDESPEPRILQDVRELADKIRFDGPRDGMLGKTILMIGAGCSISAGIPGAAEMAKLMTAEVAKKLNDAFTGDDPVADFDILYARNRLFPPSADGKPRIPSRPIDWYLVYDEMFERYYTTPDHVRSLFDGTVTQTSGAVNWAHLCIGELVARRYVSSVLTTNFDQLVLAGITEAGILPIVCDGIESLNRIAGKPNHPQLIELHGTRHTYLLRNRTDDVSAVAKNQQAVGAISQLFQNAANFVIVGYGGREDGIMDLLIKAGHNFPDKNLFWVQHSPNQMN